MCSITITAVLGDWCFNSQIATVELSAYWYLDILVFKLSLQYFTISIIYYLVFFDVLGNLSFILMLLLQLMFSLLSGLLLLFRT